MKIKLLISILIFISTFGFGQNSAKEKDEIQATYNSLKKRMIDYMESSSVDYTIVDVEKCMSLIDSFLDKIAVSETKKDGMLAVKNVVLALNELNSKCGYQLIETSEREQIAQIIILSGHLKGYNEINEDITEEWREW